jgi:hypothetical protein
MGLFNWLKSPKSNVQVLDDMIWLTTEAKLAGIARSVEDRLCEPNGPVAILLVAYFPDCHAKLKGLFETRGFDPRRVFAAREDSLAAAGAAVAAYDEYHVMDILVGERHPLASHEETVIEFARRVPCRCRLVHHLSLEDPLLRVFAGEWVENILRRLGMSEDEAIESRMVARRIQAAQRSIAENSVSDLSADSAEQWFELNCPEFPSLPGER